MNLFIFTFVYLMHRACYAVGVPSTVPVFLIDPEQVMMNVHVDPNPFAKMSTSQFAGIIHDSAINSTGVIIFVAETFSVEDISHKDTVYGTPYKHLHGALTDNRETVKYFPSVIEPYNVLKKIFPTSASNVLYVAQHSNLRLKGSFKHLHILFQDGSDESKADVLKRHDTAIKEVMNAARQLKNGPVVGYYTGKKNPVVVKKVEFVKSLPSGEARRSGLFVSSPWALFRIHGVYTGTHTRRSLQSEIPTVSSETRRDETLNTILKYGTFEMEWVFKLEDDYWNIDDIVMYEVDEEVGRHILKVRVPRGRSYYCDEPFTIVNTRDGSAIIFNEILVEPKKDGEVNKFSPSVHCTPFFNGALLAGLFVTGMLVSFLLYGIMMMMDLSTNDHYEDPDSKPLVHETMH